MKLKTTILLALVTIIIAAVQASRASDNAFANGAFTLDRLDEAKERAAKEKKPLTFIYSYPFEKEYSISYANTLECIREFKYKTVVVFSKHYDKMPMVVHEEIDARRSSGDGLSQPVAVITDVKCRQVLCSIDNGQNSNKEKAKVFKVITEYRKILEKDTKDEE